MSLRDDFERVLSEYPVAKTENFAGHKLAEFMRHGFPDAVRASLGTVSDTAENDYLVKGSAGQSQWVFCPWVAIFDPVVTVTAERGYYPVYLFREDFTGLYFSLNQGVTDVREQYRARVKEALKTRAFD